MLTAVSSSDTSISRPTPERCASHNPAMRAAIATYPPAKSTTETPALVGGPSGAPVIDIQPA